MPESGGLRGIHSLPVYLYPLPILKMAHLTLGIDKDSLLDQTLVSFLNLVLDPSVCFLVKYSISKNPAKSVYQELPTLDI